MIGWIAAALVAIGVGAVCYAVLNWPEIVSWLNGLVRRIKDTLVGVSHFIKNIAEKIGQGLAEVSNKVYYQEEGERDWTERTTTRKVREQDLDPDIRAEIQRKKEARIGEIIS